MTTDHIDLGEQIWSNLAKRCHDRNVRRMQHQTVLRNEGVDNVGKKITVSEMQSEESKRRALPDSTDSGGSGPRAANVPINSRDREANEDPSGFRRTNPMNTSKVEESLCNDQEGSIGGKTDEQSRQTKGPKGLRKELSGIGHELLELRLHLMKEEERFRLQEQNVLRKQVRRDKKRSGAPDPGRRTEPERSNAQREQRRKQRSPLRNQTNLLIDDLKGKVSALLKQRREMREEDRLLRGQLDEMRAQWEESVQQVEQARTERVKILNTIASVMG